MILDCLMFLLEVMWEPDIGLNPRTFSDMYRRWECKCECVYVCRCLSTMLCVRIGFVDVVGYGEEEDVVT